jgi:hypothetical protein
MPATLKLFRKPPVILKIVRKAGHDFCRRKLTNESGRKTKHKFDEALRIFLKKLVSFFHARSKMKPYTFFVS